MFQSLKNMRSKKCTKRSSKQKKKCVNLLQETKNAYYANLDECNDQ